MERFLNLPAALVLSLLLLVGVSSAAVVDVSVGTDDVVYDTNENVTVSGVVRYMTNGKPVTGTQVTVTVESGTLHSSNYLTDADGKFASDPFSSGSTEGTKTIVVAATGGHSGGVTGTFKVETEKDYVITTDKYTYSPQELMNATLTVTSESTGAPVSGSSVLMKIKNVNGSIMHSETVSTSSSGTATISWNITSYGEYVVVAGNGLAVAKFDVPSFNIKVDLQGEEGKSKYMFGSDDSVKVRVRASITSSSGTVIGVKNADVGAYMKDSDGNTVYTFNTTTETTDGVYETELKELSSLANGEYYVKVDVTKGSSTQTKKIWFEIQSIRVDVIPVGEMMHIMSFLNGSDVRLGLFVMDMETGDKISGDAITSATILGCRDSQWKDCLSKISGDLNVTEEGFMEFSKILRFLAPSETDEYFIEVQVNTTSGNGRGATHVSVQNVITYAETKDSFDSWRWMYGPGETVVLEAKAMTGNWQPASVTGVRVVEVRDDDWNDITDNVFDTASEKVSSTARINFTAPQDSGWFHVKMQVNTTAGNGYAGAGFEVKLYDIWVDTMDSNGNWQWRFGSDDVVYLHANVRDLGGGQVDTEDYRLSITQLRNEMTGKTYSNLNVTKQGDIPDDEMGRPVFALDLSDLDVSSGHYNIEFELTDMGGNKDRGGAWLKISNLDVWINTKSASGEWKWRFAPTDNVTFEVNANYFNGTSIPDASNITVENLMFFQMGPPMPVPQTKYNHSSENGPQNPSSGTVVSWVKAKSGDPLAQGHYMALLRIVLPDGTTENQEAWFEVSVMDVYGWADPFRAATGQNVTAQITAKKMDGTPVNGTMQLVELRDTMTWMEVSGFSVSDTPTKDTSSSSTVTPFEMDTDNLTAGQYEAVVRVTSDALGASSDAYIWFAVENYQTSGYYADQTKHVYAPGENVELWVEIKYPNGTAYGGLTPSVYQFAETEFWPWTFTDATMVSQASPTDSISGKTKLTFRAPDDTGRYRPMLNVSGELQTDPWLLPDFEVRSANVKVTLYDENSNTDDHFSPGSTVQVEVNVSNPTGGSVLLTSISMKYKDLSDQSETTLQTLTSGLGESNKINFTAPSEGEYVLFVNVKDNTTGNIIIAKKWFRVKTFDVWFHSDRWAYSAGQNVSIEFNAYNPDGSTGDMTVALEELRNMWTWSALSGIANDSVKNISGSGYFNITAPDDMGEYEAVFCVYKQTESSCGSESPRFWVGFSVESYEIHTWPWGQGSYTSDENVLLIVEVMSTSGGQESRDNFNVTLLELRDARNWNDVTSNITIPAEQFAEPTPNPYPPGNEWKVVNFSAANLAQGEYAARLNVSSFGESRVRETWFRISDYSVDLETIPPDQDRFYSGDEISFNITVSSSSLNDTGKFVIKDEYDWERDVWKNENVSIVNGNAVVNVTGLGSGKYTALAKVGNAEGHKWFMVGGYDIWFNFGPSMSQDRAGLQENITINFTMMDSTGSAYEGPVNITVTNVMNSWDWNPAPADNAGAVYSLTTSASGQSGFTWNTSGLGNGDYELKLVFNVSGKSTDMHFWFMVKTNEFWAWPEFPPGENNFDPGQNVTIKVWFADKDGNTNFDGANVSIDEVWRWEDWQDISSLCTFTDMAKWAIVQNGMAELNFTLPANLTGGIDVKIINNETSETTFTGFDVSSYDVNFYRNSDKWTFIPGEIITADVYVTKGGVPVSNVDVSAKLIKEGQWHSPLNSTSFGATDSGGYKQIVFEAPSENSHYEIELNVGGGAARSWMGFDVASFFLKTWVTGETSGYDHIGINETAVITVYAERPDGTRIQNANISLIEIRKVPEWSPVSDYSIITGSELTDSNGKADLRFSYYGGYGEYVGILNATANISGNVSSNMRDVWFRVTEYSSVDVYFTCPQGVDYCDPNKRAAGEQVGVYVGGVNNAKACVVKARNIFNGNEIHYNDCNSAPGNDSVVVNFIAPSETGEYDIQIDVYSDNTFVTDEWRWLKVGGANDYNVHYFTEPHNAWPGKNVSIFIEMWGPNWMMVDIDDDCTNTNASVIEIRDTQTWSVVNWNVSDQWSIGTDNEMGCPDCPGGKPYMLTFKTPDNLPLGHYEAQFQFTCDSTMVTGNAHFKVIAFQVSSLMSENLKSNQTVQFWIKMMDKDGKPVQGATIFKRKLIDQWNWQEIQSYSSDDNFTTDVYGEVRGNFTTPAQPGQYMLELDAVNGSTIQDIGRFFFIRGFNVDATFNEGKYWSGQTANLTVNVTNMDGSPKQNAEVRGRVHIMMGPDKDEGDQNGSYNPAMNEVDLTSNWTDSSGIATFEIPNLNSSDYMANLEVCTQNMGCNHISKPFTARDYDIRVVTDKFYYYPGDDVTVNISLLYQNGTYISNGYAEVELIKFDDKEGECAEDEECEDILDEANDTFNGNTTLTLSIPSLSNMSGESGLFVMAGLDNNNSDSEMYILPIKNAANNATIVSNGSTSVSAGTFLELNITTNATAELSVAPFVKHMSKVGGAIPMYEMFGGGPDSGKEDWYESPIYTDKDTGNVHMYIRARDTPGVYTALLMFFGKNQEMFHMASDMVTIEYVVI